jgi:hypothetical protein
VATTVATLRFADVQWLADHPRGEGMVVSCYADMSVSAATRQLWREHLDNEIRRIEDELGTDTAARSLFQRNVAAIVAALSSRRARSARGMAVFAAVQRDLVHGYALAVPVANRLVVDEEPYLMPLLELLDRQRRYLVVHTDTHRGRLYTSVPGAVHLIEEITEDVPKRQRAAGELWGKQQATIDRHRKDHILHYFKELVREVERAWPEEKYDGIVLLGAHEVLQQLRPHFPDHLAERIAGEAPYAWSGRQASLESKIGAIQTTSLEEHDRRLLEDVRRRLLEGHRIATGPEGVIEALRNGQVGIAGRIVMVPDPGATGWRCRQCGAIFVHRAEACSFCNAPCDRTNLWQAIALQAGRQHTPVHSVPAGLDLEKQGGIAALLTDAGAARVPAPATAASLAGQRA